MTSRFLNPALSTFTPVLHVRMTQPHKDQYVMLIGYSCRTSVPQDYPCLLQLTGVSRSRSSTSLTVTALAWPSTLGSCFMAYHPVLTAIVCSTDAIINRIVFYTVNLGLITSCFDICVLGLSLWRTSHPQLYEISMYQVVGNCKLISTTLCSANNLHRG